MILLFQIYNIVVTEPGLLTRPYEDLFKDSRLLIYLHFLLHLNVHKGAEDNVFWGEYSGSRVPVNSRP